MPRIDDFSPRAEERIEEVSDLAQRSGESFDRIAFAERALSLVRPCGTTVAIREGRRRVRIDTGRQWGKGPTERWAILSVPHDASRRAIAYAVLALGSYGAADADADGNPNGSRTRPWALDVLLAVCKDGTTPYRGP